MHINNTPTARELARKAGREIGLGFQKYWLRAALLGAAIYMIQEKDMAIDLQLSNIPAAAIRLSEAAEPVSLVSQSRRAVNTSLLEGPGGSSKPGKSPSPLPASREQPVNVSRLANTYSNLSNENKGLAEKEADSALAIKRKKQNQYVKRFAEVAQSEMKKFGIPASITLAQGLLESNVGESKLATRNNNHFGMKCFSRSCRQGHCSNFTDDSHKDFFRIYKSAWESYRAHSMLLKRSARYKKLFSLEPTDYKGWAKGLKKAGYATDPNYDKKLIHLIQNLGLHQYDR